MSKPIAVIISDIHFNINTLPIASKALGAAIDKANDLNLPLIIAGDLNDTKAIIRAEVANELIVLLKKVKTRAIIIEGNHDKVNEKAAEHGLNYLRPYAKIIDKITYDEKLRVHLIPYQNAPSVFISYIQSLMPSILIMHQGFLGAQMGDYVQDKTSLDTKFVEYHTVISGHYHRHQTIGSVTYIGSPYTITFGEANDGPKGFLILNEDGTFTREILNLRKHVILQFDISKDEICKDPSISPGDLVWVKLKGPLSELQKVKKRELSEILGIHNFKLDFIPTEADQTIEIKQESTAEEIFDTIIDTTGDTAEQKEYLKSLWKELV